MSPDRASTAAADVAALPRAGRWAWGLCWLMFASTALNYMDRQAIALVQGPIEREFRINNEAFGWLMAAFYITYAVMQVPAGHVADRRDVRRLYAGAVAWWSLAAVAVAVAPALGVLVALRALLGMGEAFNWPCALTVTARTLPPADRGLGNGIFNSGAAVGAVLTPLIVPALAHALGWRSAFAVLGLLGFLWAVAWLAATRRHAAALASPRAAAAATDQEGDLATGRPGMSARAGVMLLLVVVGSAAAGAVGAWRLRTPVALWIGVAVAMFGLLAAARLLPARELGSGWAASLGRIVRRRRFWVLVVVTITINSCWHFLVNWLPGYLRKDRELTALIELAMRHVAGASPAARRLAAAEFVSGALAALVFLAADAGNLLGGATSRRLAARGLRPASARWRVMAAGAALLALGSTVGRIADDGAVVVVLALMALGAAAFMANYFAFCQEVEPTATGLVVGVLGGLGNLFAAGVLPLAGWVKDTTHSFGPIFVLVSLAPLAGLAALGLFWGEEKDEG